MSTVEASSAPNQGCQFWLPMKKRHCGWKCKEGEQYCGNHLFAVTGAGEERVPCPANPKHDVPISQLKAHLKRCPEAVRQAAARAQPYFAENLNTGADLFLLHQQQQHNPSNGTVPEAAATSAAAAAAISAEACASFLKGTAEQRISAAIAKGPDWFLNLVDKINVAHAALTAAYPSVKQYLGGCEDHDVEQLFKFSRELDPLMPFDRKHAAQHASIVGSMQSGGLLTKPQESIFLELGAGKGFLTAWLHQVCGAKELILLDRQGNFIKKADRRLRHTRLTRVAVDLKDAALLPLMKLHLRGMSQESVKQQVHQQRLDRVHEQCQKVHLQHIQQQQQQVAQQGQEGSQTPQNQQQREEHVQQQPALGGLTAASVSGGNGKSSGCSSSSGRSKQQRLKNTSFGGLICCPYEPRAAGDTSAQQQHGEPAQNNNQQQQQQQMMPWVAHGKHLCGAATDFALRACYNAVVTQAQAPVHRLQNAQHAVAADIASPHDCCQISSSSSSSSSSSDTHQHEFMLQGLAIATCCHHRCGWTAYCGREVLQQFEIGRTEFETISWLTSWALCGHEAAPGTSDSSTSDQDKNDDASHTDEGTTETPAQPSPQQQHELQQQQQQQQQCDYHPADLLDRPSRVALGLRCKQLIDAGRCAWISSTLLPAINQQHQQQQGSDTSTIHQGSSNDGSYEGSSSVSSAGCSVRRVCYIDASVTGENTLLVVGRHRQ